MALYDADFYELVEINGHLVLGREVDVDLEKIRILADPDGNAPPCPSNPNVPAFVKCDENGRTTRLILKHEMIRIERDAAAN